MTDKQQQIHELDVALREIITTNFVKVPSYSKFGGYLCDTDISTTSIATALCNKHYYKVPEGSIIVDKEYLKTELQGLELQTRRETANEFYDKVSENICSFKLENKSQEFIVGYAQAIADICSRLDQVAKQFGVEVDK